MAYIISYGCAFTILYVVMVVVVVVVYAKCLATKVSRALYNYHIV